MSQGSSICSLAGRSALAVLCASLASCAAVDPADLPKSDATPSDDEGAPPTATPGSIQEPVPGFADLHNHQFAEYAYQGAWYYGTTLGEEGGDAVWDGVSACSGNAPGGPQDHAMTFLNLLCDLAGWATDDMCVHPDRRYGYAEGVDASKSYTGWPHSTSWAHQQTWWGHLKDAHDDGLNLTVVHAVSFKPLCEIMEPDNYRYFYDCEDMGAVDLEIAAAHEFAALNSSWAEIAYSPADARRIIREGRLAMVLAIEVTDIFPTGAMDDTPMQVDGTGAIVDRGGVFTQLQYFYDLGVRTVQLGHELDSRFAGVAVYSPVFELLDAIREVKTNQDGALEGLELPGHGAPNYGMKLDDDGYNTLGLTDDGRALVAEMMKLGMLLDLAHLSYQSDEDVYALAKANAYYPLFHSHLKFSDIMVLPGEEALEKYTTDRTASFIRATGGMAGLRTFSARVNTWPDAGMENNCDGSTRSFAQAYAYADTELRIPVGFGIDLNGFTTQVAARFGAESCGEAVDEDTQLEQQSLQTDPGTGTDFDRYGLGHVGLLGRGLVADMEALGADTRNLESSAEAFIRMWERSIDPKRDGPVGSPPVASDSPLQKKSTGGGLMVRSILSGPAAGVGAYTIRVSGTGSTAREAVLYASDGARLASARWDEAEVVTGLSWKTLAFGDWLTLRIGSSSDTPSDLSQLDDTLLKGDVGVRLAWP